MVDWSVVNRVDVYLDLKETWIKVEMDSDLPNFLPLYR